MKGSLFHWVKLAAAQVLIKSNSCRRRQQVLAAGVGLCAMLMSSGLLAQALRFDQKYLERVQQSQDIGKYSASSFGEQLNLKNGSVEFNWTDIDIPGNSKLPVRLQRSLVVEDQSAGRSGSLGGFDVGGSIDLPYLKGVFSTAGWQVENTNPNARCSVPGSPPSPTAIPSRDFWSGNWMHVPWAGDQLMLSASGSSLPTPGNGTSYPWVTKDFWRLSCTSTTKNGYPGEGFIALSPEGDKYYFDWAVTKTHPGLSKRIGNYSASAYMDRVVVFFLVSRIEDRFGNWVTYTYNGSQLQRIEASDGRYIQISGVSGANITTIESSVGNWGYAYSTGLLTVTQPDGSQSRYAQTGDMIAVPTPALPLYDGTPSCPLPEPSTGAFTYQVTLPSNATATYAFSVARHWIHNVPKICNSFLDAAGPSTSYQFLSIPNFSDSFTLTTKSISGPGLLARSWTYTYDIGAQPLAFESRCAASTGTVCAKTIQTEVREPEGDMQRHTFGAWYLYNSGQDMGVESGSLVGTGTSQTFNILSKTENEYVTTEEVAAMPFPDQVGPTALNDYVANAGLRPLKRRTITQQGETFQWVVNTFDGLARPVSVTRSSSLGDARSETTAYSDNLGKWVLSQVASVTKTAPGAAQVVSATTYDSITALPAQLREFGKLRQAITYNTDGTVASVVDGNNNTTSVGSWKLGLPQSITYADGTSDLAVVDSRGWISSTTDENGFTTSYSYDAMGRLSGLTYPIGDTVAWATTTQSFVPVASAEYGIPAGHWRLTVATGNARKITYMDGFWQPLLVQEYDVANQAGTQRFSIFSYDGKGRTVFSSYPSTTDGISTGIRTSYDALDRPVSISQDSELGALTTTTEYLSGLITRTTNPRLQATVTGYMAYDKPTTDWPVSISLPEGAYMDINRDEHGKPLSITRRNADASVAVTRTYSYDSYQQLCRTVEPETGATLTGYDGAGNLSWSAAGLPASQACEADVTSPAVAARRVGRTYDVRNQIKSISYLDEPVDGGPLPGTFITTYNYSPDGKLQAMASNDPAGQLVTTTYSYNRRRLPTGERLQWGDVDWSASYSYDANGSLATETSPDLTLDFSPNALGQPTKAGSYATAVSYYPNGAVKQFTYGNGIVHSMVQNARQLPARSSDTGGGNPLDMAYAYDQAANVSSIIDYTTGRQTRAMTYDGLDRLLTAQSVMFGSSPASYAYDVLDNLQTVKLKERDWTYVYSARNQLQNVMSGAATVGGLDYDAQGNLKNKNGANFKFDYGNRLRQVVGHANYLYDGAGRRVLDFTTGAKRSFYSQSGQLLYADDQRQGKTTAYVYLAGSLIAGVSNYTGPLPPAPTSAPALSAPASNTTGSYTVSWTSVASATAYKLEESSNGGTSWSQVFKTNDTSGQVAGRLSGTYSYRVSACNRGGCGPLSSVAATTVARPPVSSPTLTAPTTSASGSYAVSWTAVATATGYVVEEGASGGSTWTQIYSGPATTAPINGKTNGTYSYRALAYNASGSGPYSPTVSTTVTLPPQLAPTLTVPASNTTGTYSVSWGAVTSATRYEAEESTNGGSSWTQRYSGSALSWSASGTLTGTYKYRARACNDIGCGPYSVVGTTVVFLAPTGSTTLSAPATSYTGSYSITWTSVADATSYVLQEAATPGSYTTLTTTAANSFAIAGRATATYWYRVSACNSTGCGPQSSIASVSVTLLPTAAPSISVPASSPNGAFTVSWASVATATSYQLEESTDGTASWHSFSTTGSLSVGVSGKATATYQYRVKGCNVAGCGPYSTVGTILVLLAPTGSPTASAPTSSYTGSYSITWTSVADATSYIVQEATTPGSYATLTTTSANSFAIMGRAAATYWYRISACNGTGCGPLSSIVSVVVTLPPSAAPSISLPPSSPNGTFSVSWTSVAIATNYQLEESTDGAASWHSFSSTGSLSVGISGKTEATYQYRVKGCNVAGCGPNSSAASIVVAFPPPVPTGLAVYYTTPSASTTRYSASWGASAGATSYVLTGPIGYEGPKRLAAATVNGTPNTTLVFKVYACNANGCSATSAAVAAVPL